MVRPKRHANAQDEGIIMEEQPPDRRPRGWRWQEQLLHIYSRNHLCRMVGELFLQRVNEYKERQGRSAGSGAEGGAARHDNRERGS